jgi:hypothetical protein
MVIMAFVIWKQIKRDLLIDVKINNRLLLNGGISEVINCAKKMNLISSVIH